MPTIAEALALAVQYHQAGNLAQAEQIYRQILQANPAEGNALRLLGMVAHEVGQHQAALALLRQAVAILPHAGVCHASLATVCVALGQWDEAEASCRQALHCQPDSPEAHHNLGNVLNQRGRPQEAVASFREALRLRPGYAEAHNNLGLALAGQGQVEEAMACYREVLRLRPDLPEPHFNLGNAYRTQRRSAEAMACYEQALRLRPDYAEAHYNLGLALAEQGRLAEAVGSYWEALRCQPDSPEAHYNLGNALNQMGNVQEAVASFRDALRWRPGYAGAHNNLGLALAEQGQVEEAMVCYREALRHEPGLAEAHYNLGNSLIQMGNVQEAVACYQTALRLWPDLPGAHHNLGSALATPGKSHEAQAAFEKALRLKPNYAEALNNLAGAYKDQGRLDEAIAHFRQAIALKPDLPFIHSNLLLTLLYHPGYEPEAIFAEHLRWAEQFAAPPAAHRPLQPIQRDPGRRLRIGYVSPDFREHVLGRYSEAVIAAHDRAQFEVFCYANVHQADARTQRIKASADHWRSVVGLSDDGVADLIRQDQIDLLVDLAGHTAGNRLGVFTRKPAPIQVAHLGYAATTGLTAIDYRLTDAHYDPPGRTERYFTEKLVRLPEVQWCYLPPLEPAGGPVPARRTGQVTFGSFNSLCKVTEQVIDLWSQILKGLPGSRIVVLAGAGSAGDERVLEAFARYGVDQGRVTLMGRQSQEAFYSLHQDVDICLDTFPFSGGFTTADALWMGVPVVSLAGAASASRQGVAVLNLVGLGDLVTETPTAYVETAIRLAQDLPRRDELRSRLRERLRHTLGDVQRFTRRLEAAYRGMWEQFCQENHGSAH